jgi:hypothetical protein
MKSPLPNDSTDACEDIDAVRCAPQLDDLSGMEKIIPRDADLAETKVGENAVKFIGVFG